ncbi:MAG: 6-bladed beta-propeller [Bacteroidaceae bacterium]|nr:6-bladed beta-propeller [Bacteroidaceae bacterium]
MNKTNIFLLACCLICSYACTSQPQSTTGIPVVDFEKEYPQKDLLVSENADVEYVRLETTDEVLLDGLAGLYLSVTDRYIVTNNSKEGRIFVFNRQGKHLYNFMRKGNSGEEFMYAKKVRVDDKAEEIFVLDARNKVLVYTLDGKFKRVLDLPKDMRADDLWNYDNEWLLSYDNYNLDREGLTCAEQPFFLISKKDGQVKRIGVNAKDRIGPRIYFEKNGQRGVMAVSMNYIYKNGDEFVLSELGNDTVFMLKNDEISPLLVRTPGSKDKDVRSMMSAPLKLGDYIEVVEAPKELKMESGKIETKSVYLNLKTGECFDLNLKDDVNFVEPSAVRSSEYVEAPKNHILSMPNTDRLFRWKEEGKLKGKLAEMVDEMQEDDNPILIIYKFH